MKQNGWASSYLRETRAITTQAYRERQYQIALIMGQITKDVTFEMFNFIEDEKLKENAEEDAAYALQDSLGPSAPKRYWSNKYRKMLAVLNMEEENSYHETYITRGLKKWHERILEENRRVIEEVVPPVEAQEIKQEIEVVELVTGKPCLAIIPFESSFFHKYLADSRKFTLDGKYVSNEVVIDKYDTHDIISQMDEYVLESADSVQPVQYEGVFRDQDLEAHIESCLDKNLQTRLELEERISFDPGKSLSEWDFFRHEDGARIKTGTIVTQIGTPSSYLKKKYYPNVVDVPEDSVIFHGSNLSYFPHIRESNLRCLLNVGDPEYDEIKEVARDGFEDLCAKTILHHGRVRVIIYYDGDSGDFDDVFTMPMARLLERIGTGWKALFETDKIAGCKQFFPYYWGLNYHYSHISAIQKLYFRGYYFDLSGPYFTIKKFPHRIKELEAFSLPPSPEFVGPYGLVRRFYMKDVSSPVLFIGMLVIQGEPSEITVLDMHGRVVLYEPYVGGSSYIGADESMDSDPNRVDKLEYDHQRLELCTSYDNFHYNLASLLNGRIVIGDNLSILHDFLLEKHAQGYILPIFYPGDVSSDQEVVFEPEKASDYRFGGSRSSVHARRAMKLYYSKDANIKSYLFNSTSDKNYIFWVLQKIFRRLVPINDFYALLHASGVTMSCSSEILKSGIVRKIYVHRLGDCVYVNDDRYKFG